ncbi:undecaprenyl-phosphate glucose phosphotransferase [Gallionella capsiferriformans]|uniref:Undecaprenyl-phosphate glucose phosphotransferase n=1 Tax=Gallionella capsiferriformans (strain ES-2) TaxID=395494 RepID=D9SFM2_GALCS|nr:undecaprenyl-phosphate glucose phosphotransferase [Gallionella capsiferriformans]ADL55319.1 Undecaprenyl-phosphate glucose phosphotransferase [Gallionella capsiferriformans ES-2]
MNKREAGLFMHSGFLRPHASRISFVQRLLDAVLICSIYGVDLVRFDAHWDARRVLLVMLAVMLFSIFAEMRGFYNSWRTSQLSDEIRELLLIWLTVVAALLILAFMTNMLDVLYRSAMLSWFISVPVGLLAVRLVVRWALRYVRRHGANIRTVAVVGNTPAGHRLVQHVNAMPWVGLVVKGFFDYRQRESAPIVIGNASYTLDTMSELLRLVKAGEIDSVYVALPLTKERRIEDLVNQLADTTASVYVVPDVFVSELMHSRWTNFGGMPLVSVYETPFFGLHGWLKRLEDVVLATLILMIIWPLMLGIAVAIKVTSQGSVIFRQKRYGLNGVGVEIWKFRSMTASDDGAHVVQAKKDDARITPLGAFLRKTSLDELPQFFNVLQGTMSVVGPRPHAVAHNEQYRKLIKGYMLRHKVKPGITGLAQVNGWRGETDTLEKMQSRVECDLEYIQTWSLWLDLKIVLLTVLRGFTGRNVY